MRQNSLFFDRGGKKNFARAVSMSITLLFLVMLGYFLIRYNHFSYLLHTELFRTPMFGWLFLIYVALAVLSVWIIRLANCRVRRRPVLWAIAVFLVAFLVRALFLLTLRAPAYGGAVFGGLNLRAFFLAEQMPALVLLAVCSLSCVVVYWIARYVEDGSAPAAGLLFALYPANIVLAQDQRAMHIALLFALLSVLFALVAFSAERRGKAFFFSSLSGLSLAVCATVLMTYWLIALAFAVVWAVLFLGSGRIRKEPLRLLLIALAFCALFFPLKTFVLESAAWNRLDSNLSGAISAGAAQQARDGEAILDQLDWETLQKGYDVQGAPVRLDESVTKLWLEKDTSLRLATESAAFSASLLHRWKDAIQLLDFFLVGGVILFAWIGALLRRRGGAGDLLLWIFLLWAGAHLFSERQMITRALGMPILIILAANGVFAITGTEPRPRETGKYDACLNHGALNLGEIPPNGAHGERMGAFHPATGGAKQRHYAGGLYAAMEADIGQEKNQINQMGEIKDE